MSEHELMVELQNADNDIDMLKESLAAAQAEIARLREVVERCKQGNLNLVELGLLHGGYAEEALRIADECASALTATPAPAEAGQATERDYEAEARAIIQRWKSEGFKYIIRRSPAVAWSPVKELDEDYFGWYNPLFSAGGSDAIGPVSDSLRRGHTYDD